MSNIKNYKYDWIWDKTFGKGHLTVKYKPFQQHENILIFGKGRINYYPVMVEKEKPYKVNTIITATTVYKTKDYLINKIYTHSYPKSILSFSNSNRHKKFHPTQKPVLLLEYLIKTYTLENETVLDNCMGSGSTGIACIHLNRNFIGMELDGSYFNTAKNRIENERNING
jgi:site-specific DNA-methyltransferase (adenine-specific)